MDSWVLRPRLADAGAVAVGLLGVWMALGPYRPVLPGEAPAWWWVDLVGGIVASAILLARGRYPTTVALAVSVISLVSVAAWLAGAVSVFALAARRPWPVAAAIAAASLAIGPVQGLWRLLSGENTSWASFWWALCISAALVGWGAAVRARQQLVESLLERAERAETEAVLRADAVRQAERTRIAREMHDVLAHRLSLVSMHAGALVHRRHASPDEVGAALEVIRDGARHALQDLRAILGVLRDPDVHGERGERGDVEPAGSPPQPTLADLGRLVDDVRATGMAVHLHDELVGGMAAAAVPDDCGRTLYRVTQEALTNAARHAPGEPVDITLRGRPGADAELDVGNPLPARPGRSNGAGTGLLGISERVVLAGGRVVARGPDEGRFRVAVCVPWPGDAR